MDSTLNKIKLIVKEKIGLDSSTIGDTTIENIIRHRMHQCKLEDIDAYLLLIKTSESELNELLETTVIPETWFFRDIRPFEIIYQKIQLQLINDKTSHVKILSLPSSTGEEPYSLAMYLIDNGIAAHCFEIDAVDISKRAIQHAEQGAYGNNSFRGKHYPAYQKKYFKQQGNIYKVNTNICDKINFYPLNILHENKKITHKFNFILCRNLLIYFDAETKKIAFNHLSDFMKDDGYLFIGHSEFGSVPSDIFQNTGFEHAFALIKHNHPDFKDDTEIQIKNIKNHDSVTSPASKNINPIKKANFESLINTAKTEDRTGHAETLDSIRKLADSKKLDEAEELCRKYIDIHNENPEVLFLSGLIASCNNNHETAELFFRKSLYLEPKHYNSLTHLALLLQKNGDYKNALLLRQRADRVSENTEN